MSNVVYAAGDTPIMNRSEHPSISRRRTMAPRNMDRAVYEDEDAVRQDMAVRNAVTSLELLIRFCNEELENVRFRLQETGRRMRRFFSNSTNIDYGRLGRICAQIINGVSPVNQGISYEGDAAMIFNEVPMQVERRIAKFTLNDLATVLTSDDFEEGVVRAYSIRCPAWRCLPIREKPSTPVDEMSEFQLFNKPVSMAMTMTMDDDEDRMSLPSTRTGAGVQESIQSMEAQMAMLRRQLEFFMNQSRTDNNVNENAHAPIDTRPYPPPDHSPVVSDDEGKGQSLCSPAVSKKDFAPPTAAPIVPASQTVLPSVAPPAGPPPPPPPPPEDLCRGIMPAARKTSAEAQPLPLTSGHRTPPPPVEKTENEPINRPSVLDLCAVQLKKTGAMRSPGGTPLPRNRRSITQPTAEMDQGAYLSAALREKFRSLQHNSFSEQEDDPHENSSIWDDEE